MFKTFWANPIIHYLWHTLLLGVATSIAWMSSAHNSLSSNGVPELCDRAATIISRETGVPLDVLRAISLTETGRRQNGDFQPWPWTVNMEGVGKWFSSYDEAQSYVDKHFSRGARSFDVGCFQINYRWHGKAFSSIEEMFDPVANARYAARFLTDLHDEFGDWSRAAGAYHSRTPNLARKYSQRFDRIRARLPEPRPIEPQERSVQLKTAQVEDLPIRQKKENAYPLLISDSEYLANGSLVPDARHRARFLSLDAARPLGVGR